MKKSIYSITLAATALAATALLATSCKDNEVSDLQNNPSIPDSQKEMISFSLSDGTTQTRAGFTGHETSIAMRIQSDEKGGSGVKYTRTVATASVDGTGSNVSYSSVTFGDAYKRYWDDAFGRKGLLSVYAVAVPNASSSLKNAGSGTEKTLEDLLSKGSETGVWGSTATNTIVWAVTKDAQTKDASTVTTPTSCIDKEDLVYSNNIQADGTLGKDGVYRWDYNEGKHKPDATGEDGKHKNGRMLFFQSNMTDENAATTTASSDPGHFDRGHLIFKHALSRITIKLVAGSGFESPAPFQFAASTNIKLLGMNVKGTLNIKTGEWTDKTTDTIEKMAKTTSEPNAVGTYMAQMLPDYAFGKESSVNVAEFTIDDNVYYITQKMLFEALTYDKDGDGVYDQADGDGALVSKKGESEIKMEQGRNYNFTITVTKKQIESITATLAPWVEVTAADQTMDNSHVQFTFQGPTGGTNCIDFQFYRLKQNLGSINTTDSYTAENYSGDYKTEGAAKIEAMTGVSGKYQATGWYYDDNKTAYHFRTLNEKAADENGTDDNNKSENIQNTSDSPVKSYFTMRAGATTQDYHWGAPMTKDPTAAIDAAESYNTTDGFKNCLYKGITSTTSDLKISEIHMMSNIYVTLKTSTDGNKVDLAEAKVTLTKLSKEATVDMGIGLVTPSTTTEFQELVAPSGYWKTSGEITNEFSGAAIPQILVRGTGTPTDADYVGITITTKDGNEYYVVKELSELTATAVSGGHNVEENQKVQRWYPGHKYFYTFTITKKGIENITCVLSDWISVTAGNKDITLED